MPWKVSKPMTERLKFIARYLEGERMTDLCNEFSISRKTGYKLVRRYEEFGSSAFVDQSTSPKSHPNQTSFETEKLIIELRGDHPTWGARKIEAYLRKRHKSVPAKSTIHAILQRNNLVKSRRRRPYTYKAEGTVLSVPDTPNSLWCTDFKANLS